MKKRILSLLLALLLLAAFLPSAMAANVMLSAQNLTVNGVSVRCEKYNIDGSNFFKLRDLAYMLNGTGSQFAVGYDKATNTVTITTGEPYESNGSELLFTGEDKSATTIPSAQTILINGERISDLSVYNIGGSNFFKLRELGSAVGFDVDYDASTNTAVVLSSGAQAGKQTETSSELKELTPEQIYARCSPAVFYVEIYDEDGWCSKTGSGFFLTSDGLAVTNYHVISGAASASIIVSDTGNKYDVLGVYDYNIDEDWAVLQIGGSGFQTLEIGDANYDVGGATVYAIGSPLGLQNTISQGIISNPARRDGNMTYIQMSAAISPGSSGGALLNKYGQVIGITSATYTNGQNLNLSIPMTYLENMDTSSYAPFGSASGSNAPSGTLTLAQPRATIGLNETGSVTVTAIEKNVEGVSVRFIIDNESIVSAEWGSWNGDDIDLILTPLSIGSTEIGIYFIITDTEVVLDAKTLYVTVTADSNGEGGRIAADGVEFSVRPSNLTTSLFGMGEIDIYAYTSVGNDTSYTSYYVDDPSILECEWDDWFGDETALFIYPLSCGSTDVTIVYCLEDGTLLAQDTVHVTITADEIGTESGDSLEFSVSTTVLNVSYYSSGLIGVHAYSPVGNATSYTSYYVDDPSILECEWGGWYGDDTTLYVNPLDFGSTDITISYYLEDGTLLAQDTVHVTITSDKTGIGPESGDIVEFIVSDTSLYMGLSGMGSIDIYAYSPAGNDSTYATYAVDDPSILECEWGDWYGDYTTLYVYPLNYGSTDITIFYYMEDGTLLAQDTVSVTVTSEGDNGSGKESGNNVEFSVSTTNLTIGVHGMGMIDVHAYSPVGNNSTYTAYEVDDPCLLECEWDDWYGDETTLYVYPLDCGSTDLTIFYYTEGDTLLAQETVHVDVLYASVDLSMDECTLSVGESVTLYFDATCASEFSLSCDSLYGYVDGKINWTDSSSGTVTITAKEPGDDLFYMWAESPDGMILAEADLSVTVTK